MKKVSKTVLAMLVVIVMGQTMTSCSKNSTAENQELYENASEGDEEKKDDKPEN